MPQRASHCRRYSALQVTYGRKVEFRIIPEDADEKLKELFEKESDELIQIDHPSFFPILETGVSRELPYYLVPRREGEPLDGLIPNPEISLEERGEIVRGLASILSELHLRRIVHGPFDPRFFTWSSRKNLVTVLHHRSRPEEVPDTLMHPYVPEDVRQLHRGSSRADCYHWGALAFRILSRGQSPYPSLEDSRAGDEGARSILEAVPRLARPLAHILDSALSGSPEERPRNGPELLTLLNESHRNLEPEASHPLEAARSRTEAQGLVATRAQVLSEAGRIPSEETLAQELFQSSASHMALDLTSALSPDLSSSSAEIEASGQMTRPEFLPPPPSPVAPPIQPGFRWQNFAFFLVSFLVSGFLGIFAVLGPESFSELWKEPMPAPEVVRNPTPKKPSPPRPKPPTKAPLPQEPKSEKAEPATELPPREEPVGAEPAGPRQGLKDREAQLLAERLKIPWNLYNRRLLTTAQITPKNFKFQFRALRALVLREHLPERILNQAGLDAMQEKFETDPEGAAKDFDFVLYEIREAGKAKGPEN